MTIIIRLVGYILMEFFSLFVMILLLAVLEVQHNESVSLIISLLSRAVIEHPTSWLWDLLYVGIYSIRLCSLMEYIPTYHDTNHFTANIIDETSQMWYHDGMQTGVQRTLTLERSGTWTCHVEQWPTSTSKHDMVLTFQRVPMSSVQTMVCA